MYSTAKSDLIIIGDFNTKQQMCYLHWQTVKEMNVVKTETELLRKEVEELALLS